MTSYTFRRSTLTKPETWTLFKEGIRYEEKGVQHVDYGFNRLKSIRLSYFPTRMKANNYVCTLTFAPVLVSGPMQIQNQKQFEIKLMSVSYDSFATFTDNANDYRAFIEALVPAAILENSSIQLISGKKTGIFIFENIAVLAILAILFYFFSILGNAGYATFIVIKIAIIVYSLFYIWKAFKANKPGVFSADKIPQKVLPSPALQ